MDRWEQLRVWAQGREAYFRALPGETHRPDDNAADAFAAVLVAIDKYSVCQEKCSECGLDLNHHCIECDRGKVI